MGEKMSFQNIVDALTQKTGVNKKVAETFSKAFFDTIVETLSSGEDSVKIKGLGVFRLVKMESRESVNVTNGERIVISGYNKISFTPEDYVVKFLNSKTESLSLTETETEIMTETETETGLEETEETEHTAEQQVVDELLQNAEPEKVESTGAELDGIDMLIATPESVEEVRLQYEEAKIRMEEAMEEARKAIGHKIRLEQLLELMESEEMPEPESAATESMPSAAESMSAVAESMPSAAEPMPSAAESMSSATETETESKSSGKEKKRKSVFPWMVVLLVALLFAVVFFFLYRTSASIESVENVQVKEVKTMKPKKKVKPEAKPTQPLDSIKTVEDTLAAKKDTMVQVTAPDAEHAPAESQNPQRPTTYRMQRGESLTRISQRFYGTKDSVAAIIRVNTFIDPNNVPVGAIVKLP